MKNKLLKKILGGLITSALVLNTTAFALVQNDSTLDNLIKSEIPADNPLLKGIIYNNGYIEEVKDVSQLNVNASTKIDIDGNKVYISCDIEHDGNHSSLNTKGILYESPVSYYSGNKIIGLLNDTDIFEYLHFSIEKNADDAFLLKPNKSMLGKTVVRIVVKNKSTDEIIFIEDTLNINLNTLNLKSMTYDENIQESLNSSENWYLPFIKNDIPNEPHLDAIPPSDDIEKEFTPDFDYVTQSVSSDDPYDLPYSFSVSKLKTVGKDYDSNTNYGYHKDSVIYPVGSKNVHTHLTMWEYSEKVPSGEDDNEVFLQVKMLVNNQFIYIDSKNKVELFDDFGARKIKNTKLAMYYPDGSDEFFYNRWFLGKTSDNSHPVKAALALCKYTSSLYYAWTELTNKESIYIGSNNENWPTDLKQHQESFNGKVVRGVAGECTESLENEGDYFLIKGSSLDQGTSSKKLYFNAIVSLYGRNSWGFFTEKLYTPDEKYYIRFYR